MSKYTPLKTYLKDLPPETCDITLSFDQIERIINDRLPVSASQHVAWWENELEGSHVQAHAWMDAGWVVGSINLPAIWVRFLRKQGLNRLAFSI